MKKITWLQLSDIHFTNKTAWRDSATRDQLLDFLAERIESNPALKPDLVFCTGDIAFGEQNNSPLAEQYKMASIFFDSLLGRLKLDKEKLFVVPGNHDINRSRINNDAQETLVRKAKDSVTHAAEINRRFTESTKEFTETISRLDEYRDFIKEYLPHQFNDRDAYGFGRSITVHGINVGIVGFNSAWSCSGDNDDRHLWMAAEAQFNLYQTNMKTNDINIGLIHHPNDWLNQSDRDILSRRIPSEFDFWLHGHSHNAWVQPTASCIQIAAGAIGAELSDEFGVNITTVDLNKRTTSINLFEKKSGTSNWKRQTIENHADDGVWTESMPSRAGKTKFLCEKNIDKEAENNQAFNIRLTLLQNNLDEALQFFTTQPSVWVNRLLSDKNEMGNPKDSGIEVGADDLIDSDGNCLIKAPPQYGLTCLALYLAKESWRRHNKVFVYLDASLLNNTSSSINGEVKRYLSRCGFSNSQKIDAILIDNWSADDKDCIKKINTIIRLNPATRILCFQRYSYNAFFTPSEDFEIEFPEIYLLPLGVSGIRSIVCSCNDKLNIGDEKQIMRRIVSDITTLNIHRTPLNCFTLLKVAEKHFDESPVNRSEMVNRILFLIFLNDEIPAYKTKPDLKDCEFVLGHFCQVLLRRGDFTFSRDEFISRINSCCEENYLSIEIDMVFDTLFRNNIVVRSGNIFRFKFSYWVCYFLAQRMYHDKDFSKEVLTNKSYGNLPEIVEFYTGIDRKREDAISAITDDIGVLRSSIHKNHGIPEDLDPYEFAQWKSTDEMKLKMKEEISEGIKKSNLPEHVKDQYLDRNYDPQKPHTQEMLTYIDKDSLHSLTQLMKAGSRALRNSDYISPDSKNKLINELLSCWHELTMILLVIAPILAKDGRASFAGINFVTDVNDEEIMVRFNKLLCALPMNVVNWFKDDIFSQKMSPLIYSKIDDSTSPIIRHELILLIIEYRPPNWVKILKNYINSIGQNSFYLLDVFKYLKEKYQYSDASQKSLSEMEGLIKIAMGKHLSGELLSIGKAEDKIKRNKIQEIIPRRNDSQK